MWTVSSESVGYHCSDIVFGDVDLLVPERWGHLVNLLGHVLLVVAQPRFGRTSHSAKINRDHAMARRQFRDDLMELPPSLGPARQQEHGRAFATLDIVDAGAVHFGIAVPEITGK